MQFRLTHIQKSLLITMLIELIIIAVLFNVGFKEKPREQTYAVQFIDDDFDFEELKPKEEIELPDISKYMSKKSGTNRASNALQEDKSFEEFRQQQENAIREFYKNKDNKQKVNIGIDEPRKEKQEPKKEKRYTGDSNIRYFLNNRYDVYLTNPLYTCPTNMSGFIVIDIEIDRSGSVVSAKFNKRKSSATAECLIESAIEAARDTYFNKDLSAPVVQKGYITYQY